MGGVDQHLVAELQELVVQRVVEHPRHLLGGEAARSHEVGSAHVADEEGVAGHHHLRLRSLRGVDDEDGNALGRVARRLQEAQDDLAHPDLVAVLHRAVGEGRGRPGSEDDLCPRALRQLDMAAHEVGVQVRLHDVADGEALRVRLGHVLFDVALGIDHRGLALGADQVGSVGQAAEIELLEVHVPTVPASAPRSRAGRRRAGCR